MSFIKLAQNKQKQIATKALLSKNPPKKKTTTSKTTAKVATSASVPTLSSGIDWAALKVMKDAGLSEDQIRALDPNNRPPTAAAPGVDPIQQLTELQFAPQRNQLQRNISAVDAGLQQSVNTQKEYGNIGDQKIASAYQQLSQQLESLLSRTKENFSGAQNQLSQTYDSALAGQKQVGQQGIDSVTAAAQALGLGAAAPDAVSRLAALTSQQVGNTEASKAGAVGNLQTLGAGMAGVGLQGIGDAAKEGAQSRSNLAQQILAAINQSTADANTQKSDLYGQLSDLASEQGAAYMENSRQDRLDRLAEEIQRGTLDIQRGQLGLSAQELYAKLNQPSDPYELLKTQAEIERINSETAVNQAKLVGTGNNAAARFKGQQGLEQWLNTPTSWWGQAAGPNFRNGISSLIQQSTVQAAQTGVDPYQLAVQAVQKKAPQLGLNPDALFTALNIFFNKYASNS